MEAFIEGKGREGKGKEGEGRGGKGREGKGGEGKGEHEVEYSASYASVRRTSIKRLIDISMWSNEH